MSTFQMVTSISTQRLKHVAFISLSAITVSCVISYYIYYQTTKESILKITLANKEKISKWKPTPLFLTDSHQDYKQYYEPILINEEHKKQECINLLSFDYLTFSKNKTIKNKVKNAILHYNVGACSARNFYGTMDVHTSLEKYIVHYFGADGSKTAAVYPDYASLPPSVVKCFVKKSDIIIIDEGCHYLLSLLGSKLLKSNVKVFKYKHNDAKSLSERLKMITTKYTRCHYFIITEGVFYNFGDICKLKEILNVINDQKKIKKKCYLILDDSHALGIINPLGSVGYHNISISDIDIYISSMDMALASAGGFCIVDKELEWFQRITSFSYCFSAALPPFNCVAAQQSLDLLVKQGKYYCSKLQNNAKLMRNLLGKNTNYWHLDGDDNIPLIHLRFKNTLDIKVITQMCEKIKKENIWVTPFVPFGQIHKIPLSLKMCVSVSHTKQDITASATIIKKVLIEFLETKDIDANMPSTMDTLDMDKKTSDDVYDHEEKRPNIDVKVNMLKKNCNNNQYVMSLATKINVIWSYIIYSFYVWLNSNNNNGSLSNHDLGFNGFAGFWVKYVATPQLDCLARPLTSKSSAKIQLAVKNNKNHKTYINVGSYCYSGLNDKTTFMKDILSTIDNYGWSSTNPSCYSTTILHRKLERMMSKWIDSTDDDRDTMIYASGWTVNFSALCSLIDKTDLIISDSENHNSMIAGAKCSGARIKIFKHNNMTSLENIIIESILENKYKKILILVESVYSMSGDVCNLVEIIKLKEKYNCYLYVDEAHSIGAIGQTGHGICEYFNINPNKIDILMGTFSKGFASIGGFISGKKTLISAIRYRNVSQYFGTSLSPPCIQQIICALNIMVTEEFKNDMKIVHQNADMMRNIFIQNGLITYGSSGVPIICIVTPRAGSGVEFSRRMLKKGIAVVYVAYPATPVTEARIRFCLTPHISKHDLSKVVQCTLEIGKELNLFYNK
eukprot:94631_1